jgi:hypothetical protein
MSEDVVAWADSDLMAWLTKQSNVTAMALAMSSENRLPECLTLRLQQISGIGGPPGKPATGILEMAA